MFTLDQARSFVAVAEELHFGRAAERLNMTQPPLSRQIQKLERAVGVELLERDNRKVALTAAGNAFLVEARKLIIGAERAPKAAQRIAAGVSGQVRVGFTASTGFSILGPLLAKLGEELPDVDVELEELVTGQQMAAIADGDLDFGLARPVFDADAFESHLLFREDLLVAVPSGYGLDRSLTFADLNGVPLIMHSPTKARYFYDLVVRNIPVDHGNVVHTVSQVLTMVALVAGGRGVAFVPASVRLLGLKGVSYLQLADLQPGAVELHAIWSRGARTSTLNRVLEVIRGEAFPPAIP